MEDQGRHPDRGQQMAGFILVVGSKQRLDTPGTRCGALEPAKRLDEGFIIAHARRIDWNEDTFAPVLVQCGHESIEYFLAQAIWFGSHRSKGAKHHESRGS